MIVEQLIVNDVRGIPKGMIVIEATHNPDGSFLANARHELSVVTSQSITECGEQIESLTVALSDAHATIATLSSHVTTLEADKDLLAQSVADLQHQIVEMHSIVADLTQYRPYDPNVIRSQSFFRRLTGDELFQLGVLSSTQETAKNILLLLNQYVTNEWRVVLDDPQVLSAMQYLSAVLPMSEERMRDILRPANRDEAFNDDD